MDTSLALFSLFASSFLSATLLPGNSEAVLTAMLWSTRIDPLWLLSVAVIGNTLGGLTNVIIGRVLPQPKQQRGLVTATAWLQRYGSTALLLSWLPVIGDLLCVLAGWLRLPWLAVLCFMFIGKALRYIALLVVWQSIWGGG